MIPSIALRILTRPLSFRALKSVGSNALAKASRFISSETPIIGAFLRQRARQRILAPLASGLRSYASSNHKSIAELTFATGVLGLVSAATVKQIITI